MEPDSAGLRPGQTGRRSRLSHGAPGCANRPGAGFERNGVGFAADLQGERTPDLRMSRGVRLVAQGKAHTRRDFCVEDLIGTLVSVRQVFENVGNE
jgi:hypothetical protein